MRAILGPLRKYAEFSGRASRSEFWLFMLFVTLLTVAAQFLDARDGPVDAVALNLGKLELAVTLLLLLPSIAVGVRRLHDTGKSGWWTMLVYLPWLGFVAAGENEELLVAASGALLLGGIVWIILLLIPGDATSNRFGAPPD